MSDCTFQNKIRRGNSKNIAVQKGSFKITFV